ncbi:MAG: YebC/PmpR family DNA-binding transcriptional regulator [Gemmataceae bacterium]
MGHDQAQERGHRRQARQAWSKLSRAIIIAARHGGGDPDANLKLRYAIDKARSVSMPKDNIERAIKRGTGDLEGVTYEEILYEGYGPGGVAILVDVLTDNRNRTVGEIRKIFERSGGKLGTAGCVGYLFERKAVFNVPTSAADEDTLMNIALEAGADDLKRSGDTFDVTADPSAFAAVQEALQKNNIQTNVADVHQVAKVPVDADAETGAKVIRLMEALDDHDDVQNVWSNVHFSEAMLEQMEKS